MPRNCLMDVVSSGQVRETINNEMRAREHWFKHNRDCIWYNNIGPIQGRIMAICQDKKELSRKLMDSRDEYFKFCVPPPKPAPPAPFTIQVGPDPCDECYQDPTIPMRIPPEEQKALLYEGQSSEGGGTKGYLTSRYNCGLPETKFCRPPTSNSEYGWKLLESVLNKRGDVHPRKNSIGSFYRSRGVLCKPDFAPFQFP